MKIIQVNPYFYPHVGGSEWYCYQLSRHLAERGHEVHVFTSRLDKNIPVLEERDGFYIHRYYCPGIIWNTNPATFIMHDLIRAKADIIHAHSYIFLTSNQVALSKKFNDIPFLLHLHGTIASPALLNTASTNLLFQVKNRIYDQTIGKWTVEAANRLASVSKADIENATKLWDLDSNKTHWIPNAIDINLFNGNNHNDNLNVIFIGRLETPKGVHTFIEVAGIILGERDDVTFTIVGDGSLRNYVENNDFNGRIKVLGRVPHSQIPNILSNSSVLVLPSNSEGLPTVCLEALASEVPVVASGAGGTSEIVIEKETGFLIPIGNSKTFVNRIMNLLDDEKSRRKMGRNGRRLVEKYYTWDKVVEKTEKIYKLIHAHTEAKT